MVTGIWLVIASSPLLIIFHSVLLCWTPHPICWDSAFFVHFSCCPMSIFIPSSRCPSHQGQLLENILETAPLLHQEVSCALLPISSWQHLHSKLPVVAGSEIFSFLDVPLSMGKLFSYVEGKPLEQGSPFSLYLYATQHGVVLSWPGFVVSSKCE